METSYFLLLQENIQETKDGPKLESSDLIIVTSRKNIKTQNLIGVLTVDHRLATVTFRKASYFTYLEKIEKIFNIDKFTVTINTDLESNKRETTVKNKVEPESQKLNTLNEDEVFGTPTVIQNPNPVREEPVVEDTIKNEISPLEPSSNQKTEARICTKHLNQIFACPYLVDEDKDTTQAFNCLLPNKQCPMVVQCKKPVFFPVLQSHLDFEEYDFYRFDFENNSSEYSLGVTQNGSMTLTKRK